MVFSGFYADDNRSQIIEACKPCSPSSSVVDPQQCGSRTCFPQSLLGPARTCLGPTWLVWWVSARCHSEAPHDVTLRRVVAPVFFARSWLVAPMAQPAAKCSAPQHRVSCPKRARGCGAWVDWFTAHSVHSSQFTSHGFTRRLHAFLSRPRRCSRKDQPSPKTSFAFGRCYPRPTAAVDGATQVVLSCLSAERTSEYYSNGCARVWHLPRSIAAAGCAIARAFLFCLLG